MSLRLVPVTRDQAVAYIAETHRHHGRPVGYRFAVGVAADGRLVGVATAGRPVARSLDDGRTIEVTRVATDGTPNACSMLYGACWRAAQAIGYTRAITYTQADESGSSLRASGWTRDADLPPRVGWTSRPGRTGASHGVARTRWVKTVPSTRTTAVEIPGTVHEVTTGLDTWYREPGTEEWHDGCGEWVTTGQLAEMLAESDPTWRSL